MSPLTRAEASDWRETSLHADVLSFLDQLSERRDPRLHRTDFGTSHEGRVLPLLVLSDRGVHTPEQARALGRPVVLLLCGIHPGEVEGKEAAMMLLRELLDTPLGDVLRQLTLVIVPLFNPDGNDRIDPANRRLDLAHLEGQPDPVGGVGTRVNALKVNLNRDYMRQEAPEMRRLTKEVWLRWMPDLSIDCHATNGSVHRMAMTVDTPHLRDSSPPGPIRFMREVLVPQVSAAVRHTTGYDSGWYGNFVEDEDALAATGVAADPASRPVKGWVTYPHHPRFGGNYRGLWGRCDLLLEAYSYVTFRDRVLVTLAWQRETLRFVAAHAATVRHVAEAGDHVPEQIAVRSRLEVEPEPVTILSRSPRTLEGVPSVLVLPHHARFVGEVVVRRPPAYLVSPAVAELLGRHGFWMDEAQGELEVEVPVVAEVGRTAGRAILEAAATGDVHVSWRRERRAVPAGWKLVPTGQRGGAVVVYLCEPASDDGLVEAGVMGSPEPGAEWPAWRVGAAEGSRT